MLTATELMIGNKVLARLHDSNILDEIVITPELLPIVANNKLTIFPIPITEKLLEKRCDFGSSVQAGGGSYKDLPAHDDVVHVVRKFFPYGGYMLVYKSIKVELMGLHHLQNIWTVLFNADILIK